MSNIVKNLFKRTRSPSPNSKECMRASFDNSSSKPGLSHAVTSEDGTNRSKDHQTAASKEPGHPKTRKDLFGIKKRLLETSTQTPNGLPFSCCCMDKTEKILEKRYLGDPQFRLNVSIGCNRTLVSLSCFSLI